MRKLVLLLIAALVAPAWAVSTSHWTQNSQGDFKAGTLHNTVASNIGELKLARSVKTLLNADPRITMVTALAQTKDGTIYAGTAPQAVLLQINGEKVTTAATIDDAVSITSLLAEPDGSLILGVSGAKARVLRIDKPGAKPTELFSQVGVQYVWALARTDDGTLYAATGPNGQLFAIHSDGKQEQIYKSDENNLTAMVSDGKDYLYVGTDPDGLIVRVDRTSKDAFILYNADEQEVTALALDEKGNLYAATGEAAVPEQPGQPPAPPKDESGRAQSPVNVPLPSQPPSPPKPPAPPVPNPNQPAPIPQLKPRASAEATPVYLVADMDEQPPDQQPPPGIPGLPVNTSQDQAKPDDKTGKNAPAPGAGEQKPAQGNAIYQIDPQGFVTEVFRQQVVIYSMVANKGVLLVGTGDNGEIYQIDPAAQETVVVAKTDSKQVSSLLAAPNGQIYLGLSNTGAIASMSEGYADSGTFISPVLDATQASRFGVIQMHGWLPKSTGLTVSTRSGNIEDPDAQGWSKWTTPASAQEFLPVGSPSARFLQYQINFSTSDSAATPVIRDVDVAYQLPHLAPVIKSIKIVDAPQAPNAQPAPPPTPAGKPGDAAKPQGTGNQTATWDASDIDNDALAYTLYFRRGPGSPWILLKDKLSDTSYTWDTRSMADGRYEIEVIASDALANPPGEGKTASRVSDVLVVDNTPPVIGDLKTTLSGRMAKIELRVTDQTSTVASMEYSVDSSDAWQAVLPVDKIFDKSDETVSFRLTDLPPGMHEITLRAADSHGNVAYQSVPVTISEK